MQKSLRILLFVDEPDKIVIIKTHIRKYYPNSEIVITQNKEDFLKKVSEEKLEFNEVFTYISTLSVFTSKEIELLLRRGIIVGEYSLPDPENEANYPKILQKYPDIFEKYPEYESALVFLHAEGLIQRKIAYSLITPVFKQMPRELQELFREVWINEEEKTELPESFRKVCEKVFSKEN